MKRKLIKAFIIKFFTTVLAVAAVLGLVAIFDLDFVNTFFKVKAKWSFPLTLIICFVIALVWQICAVEFRKSANDEEKHYVDESKTKRRHSRVFLKNYLRTMKLRCEEIDFKGIDVFTNQSVGFIKDATILDLYSTQYIRDSQGFSSNSKVSLFDFVYDKKVRGVIIEGEPGAGKSTFLKYFIRKTFSLKRNKSFVPFIIELEDFSNFIVQYDLHGETIENCAKDLIANFVVQDNQSSEYLFSVDDVINCLKKQGGCICFDGLDEVPEGLRRNVLKVVEKTFVTFSNCKILLTTRPYAIEKQIVLAPFKRVHIDIFNTEQINNYITKLSKVVGFNNDITYLLEQINNSDAIYELAQIPAMLTFMCLLFFSGRIEIPDNRTSLIESIIGWLIEKKNVGNYSTESIVMHYTEVAQKMIELGKSCPSKDIKEEDIFNSITGDDAEKLSFISQLKDVGVMVELKTSMSYKKYTFWHYCFQEYLTGRYMCEKFIDNDDEIGKFLIPHFYDKDWLEIIIYFSISLLKTNETALSAFIELLCSNLIDAKLSDKVKAVGVLSYIFRAAFPQMTFLKNVPSWQIIYNDILLLLETECVEETTVLERSDAITAIGLVGDKRLEDFNNTFCLISGGAYISGAQPFVPYYDRFDPEATEFEYPIRRGMIESYEIRKYPISVQEYELFIQSNGYKNPIFWEKNGYGCDANNPIHSHPRNWVKQVRFRNSPITGVSWFEAQAYCQYLNMVYPNYIHRLPTEIEWEYAFYKTHFKRLCKINALYEDSLQIKTPIGIFPQSNSYNGITDMLGNIEEWCEDSWAVPPPAINNGQAYIDSRNISAVVRGGSTIRTPRLCRPTYRGRCNKDNRYPTIGFRIVRIKKENS